MPIERGAVAPATRAAGFTLIEVLVVLVIMGLMLAIFVSRATSRHPVLDLRAAADSIAEGLRLARSRAIATDRPCDFVLNVAAHAWRVCNEPPHSLPQEMAITITTVAGGIGGTDAAIGFAPDGSATGGRIDLAAGPGRASVAVDWLTGRVSVDAR